MCDLPATFRYAGEWANRSPANALAWRRPLNSMPAIPQRLPRAAAGALAPYRAIVAHLVLAKRPVVRHAGGLPTDN